jgi:uncharacterized protein (DUF58 family)
MIIPTRRTILLGFVPLLLIAISGGSAAVIEVAWALLAVLLAAWLFDGIMVNSTQRVTLERNAPVQIHIDQTHPIEWIAENRSSVPAIVELQDQLPDGTTADLRVLKATIAPNSRTRLEYRLVPSVRGNLEFGDLYYRIQGRFGLAWKLQRQSARQAVRCYPHLANWTHRRTRWQHK